MYSLLQHRFCETIFDINETLIGIALEPRLMPGMAADTRSLASIASLSSSASTPSLRSRDGSVTPIGHKPDPGGNVRVVVRVRGFLPRGRVI